MSTSSRARIDEGGTLARVEAGVPPRQLPKGGRIGLVRPIWRPLKGSATEFLALLGGVVLWEALGHLLALPWLPPFSRAFAALVELVGTGVIVSNLFASLKSLFIGFGVSLILGLGIGALMARYRKVEYALDIYVNAMIFAPAIVFAPIFFTIFGLSDMTRIAVVILYAVFIMVINTFTAIRTVDPALLEMARSFGASEGHIFMRVLIPASLPVVFAGIRLGMGRAVRGMINGEQFIAFVGLGALAQKYGSQFDASKVLAISLVILIVALLLNWLVQAIDAKTTSWAD